MPKITRAEARRRLVEILFPDDMAGDAEARRNARARLRNRTKRAVENGEIPTRSLWADVPFSRWIMEEYNIGPQDWFPDVMLKNYVTACVSAPFDLLPYIPTDPAELREWGLEKWRETEQLKKRITELETENQALRDKLSGWGRGRPKGGGL